MQVEPKMKQGVMRHQNRSSTSADQYQCNQNNQKFSKIGHRKLECRSDAVHKSRDREVENDDKDIGLICHVKSDKSKANVERSIDC